MEYCSLLETGRWVGRFGVSQRSDTSASRKLGCRDANAPSHVRDSAYHTSYGREPLHQIHHDYADLKLTYRPQNGSLDVFT